MLHVITLYVYFSDRDQKKLHFAAPWPIIVFRKGLTRPEGDARRWQCRSMAIVYVLCIVGTALCRQRPTYILIGHRVSDVDRHLIIPPMRCAGHCPDNRLAVLHGMENVVPFWAAQFYTHFTNQCDFPARTRPERP